MDQKVLLAQQWYNATYAGKNWYKKIDEDGITGYGTFNALCRALQYEIGLTSGIDGVIGPGTLNACPTIGTSTTNKNLIKIIQCGFYCKGYECGDISGKYDSSTVEAAKKFRSDAGFPHTTGNMPPLFIKALLNTDAYVLVSKGKAYVRYAQQYLNNTYFINMGTWGLIPCNGITDRFMMKGIIAALQYEEAGKSMNGVDGIYGDNTLNKAPLLSQGSSQKNYVKIAQMCLMCMMETDPGIDGVFDSDLRNDIQNFQDFYTLTSASSGTIDRVTWASLLSSKGDSSRKALACDTSFQLNASQAKSLYNDGYRYIGRYLSGSVGSGSDERPKNLTREELSAIFTSGLRVFAIFQEGAVSPTKFTEDLGVKDANKAITTAMSLGIPAGEMIYFAIDCDMTDDQITSYAIPYFRGIHSVMANYGKHYRTGIYGSRNVCTRVTNAGFSESSFVSDMSTGFSGNLGYKIPSNWAFDQFHEFSSYSAGGTTIALDKVAYSGRYTGFNRFSDATFLDAAKEVLSYFGIHPSLTFELGTKYHQDFVSYYYTYMAGTVNTFDINTEETSYSPVFEIHNGSFDVNFSEHLDALYNSMDVSMKAKFDKLNGFSILPSLATNLENAKLKIGANISHGYLELELKLSKDIKLADGETTTLYFQIILGYRNIQTPAAQEETVLALAESSVILIIVITFYIFSILDPSSLIYYAKTFANYLWPTLSFT